MTTTETDAPPEEPGEQPPADESAADAPGDGTPPQPPALEAPTPARNEPLWTRAILPLALPILAAVATAVWVINLSRAFIVGGKEGALIVVMVVTLSIMAGASMMSAASRMRTGTSVMLTAALFMVIVTTGIITLGPSEDHGEGEATGYVEPKGPAVATIPVVAGPGTFFDEDEYTTVAGINEIDYISRGVNHTLVFEGSEFAGFKLVVPPDDKGKVDLAPGEYVIYCDLPGHRAGGMEAGLIVEEGSGEPAPGSEATPPSS
jgi:plastocyanin